MTGPASAHPQLALNVRLRDDSAFDNFLAARNAEAFDRVVAFTTNTPGPTALLYLWGERGAGKTHLLEAACRERHARGDDQRSSYSS